MEPSESDRENREIIAVLQQNDSLRSDNSESAKSATPVPTEINYHVTLTDNVMVMIVKQVQYVESLTGYKTGFLFGGETKPDICPDTITKQIIPTQYWEVWDQIEQGKSKRCINLRSFLKKMLASKSQMMIKEIFRVYIEAIVHLLYIESKFKEHQINERQLMEFSRIFSRNFCKRVISQNEYKQFMGIEEDFVSIALLNRNIDLREITKFQDNFNTHYAKWKIEFAHLIEVIYFCLSMEFYDINVNYLYEGYFKNTEFETERNMPKLRIRNSIF